MSLISLKVGEKVWLVVGHCGWPFGGKSVTYISDTMLGTEEPVCVGDLPGSGRMRRRATVRAYRKSLVSRDLATCTTGRCCIPPQGIPPNYDTWESHFLMESPRPPVLGLARKLASVGQLGSLGLLRPLGSPSSGGSLASPGTLG